MLNCYKDSFQKNALASIRTTPRRENSAQEPFFQLLDIYIINGKSIFIARAIRIEDRSIAAIDRNFSTLNCSTEYDTLLCCCCVVMGLAAMADSQAGGLAKDLLSGFFSNSEKPQSLL